jgi:hypothetical protein
MGMFNDINDAMGQVGGLLNSPAMTSVTQMQNASTSLNVTANLDQYTLEQGFPGHGNAFYQQMQEIQNLSDAFDECGNYAQDIIQASTEDYIKNTGIQEAGRDLANTLGQYSDEIDCVAGFATLFDSKGILDDVLGLGDLPQIQSRVQQIILDVTDPSKLANMITNLDAVQGLLQPFNDMCTGMKDAFNKLVAKDLAALNAILNKLAQWAAFTNLATGDPCALVNNNRMFNSITDPVMDDIIDLYNGVLGGNPIVDTIADIFAPDTPTALLGGGGLTQAAGGVVGFEQYFSTLGTPIAGVTTSIGNIVKSDDVLLSDFLSDNDSDVGLTTAPLEWNGTEWADTVSTDVISGMSSITSGIGSGSNSFNSALDNFKSVKEEIEFESLNNSTDGFKQFKVENCSGGSGLSETDCLNSGGAWNLSTYTTNDPTLSNMNNIYEYDSTLITKTNDGKQTVVRQNIDLNSVVNGIDNDMATEQPSGPDVIPAGSMGKPASKPKAEIEARASQGVISPLDGSPIPENYSPPSNTNKLNPITDNFNPITTAAKIQNPERTSSFESSVTQFDANLNQFATARQTNDYSKISVCKCIGKSNYINQSSCESNGGNWVCQKGTDSINYTKQRTPSTNMITSAKNVELSSVLPTAKAFVGIV